MLEVSLVINTRNEEHNLPRLLEQSQGRFSEVLVVDMESEDRTVEIARALGARVLITPKVLSFDRARVDAVKSGAYDWVLILDADEELSATLYEQICHIVVNDIADVVDLPFANLALSGFAPHESGFPEYHLRLFRRSKVDIDGYEGRIHTFFEPLAGARRFKVPGRYPDVCVRHYTSPTVSTYLRKLDRYTTIEAVERAGNYRGSAKLILHFFLKPVREFGFHYLWRRGFLDGWQGLWQSLIFVIYDWLVLAKVWEIQKHGGKVPTDAMARDLMYRHVASRSKASE